MKFGRVKGDMYEIQATVRSLRQKMRGENKVYDGNVRQEWYNTNLYTSDTTLLDDLLQDDHMMRYLVDMRYTSEEYETQMSKLEGIPTDVKLVKKKQPGQEYKVYLSSTIGKPWVWENTKNLKGLIEINSANVQINKYLMDRIANSGCLYTSDHYFYCDDPDVIMMMYLGAPGAIRKVYKIVERD